MKSLVIYDNTGKIYLIIHGEEAAPQGLQCIWVDIPDGFKDNLAGTRENQGTSKNYLR